MLTPRTLSTTSADRLDIGRLTSSLGASPFAARLLHYETVGSTNDLARELARRGAADLTVVVAEEQRAGRGRRRRRWESPAGGGLYLSIVLRPSQIESAYAAGVQLAAGVALAETLAPHVTRRPELLWPNDLFCDGKKLAGVLVESEASSCELDFLVCGIGANVNQRASDFSAEVATVAGSLCEMGSGTVDRTTLLAGLLESFGAWEAVARTGGVARVIESWHDWSPSAIGADVEVETVDGVVRGMSAGLSPGGGLQVDVAGDLREILVGELIRVRRRT